MESQLVTTNLFLGILAAMAVFQMLVVIGMGIGMFVIYGRTRRAYLNVIDLAAMAEARVTPTMVRVNAILDDVKDVTATVKDVTDRVDHTAERVRSSVFARTSSLVGFVRGARAAIETILNTRAA